MLSRDEVDDYTEKFIAYFSQVKHFFIIKIDITELMFISRDANTSATRQMGENFDLACKNRDPSARFGRRKSGIPTGIFY